MPSVTFRCFPSKMNVILLITEIRFNDLLQTILADNIGTFPLWFGSLLWDCLKYMRGMREGIVQLVFGRKVLLLNQITSYGLNGLVIVFSTVQSQAVSAKQPNKIYPVKMEKVVIMKLGNSGSAFRIWFLCFALRNLWAPTIVAWSATVSHREYVTSKWVSRLMCWFRILHSNCFERLCE